MRLYLAEDGVHQPRLFGRGEIFIPWSSLTTVRTVGLSYFDLCAGDRKVRINHMLFKNPTELARVIDEQWKRARSS